MGKSWSREGELNPQPTHYEGNRDKIYNSGGLSSLKSSVKHTNIERGEKVKKEKGVYFESIEGFRRERIRIISGFV